MGNRERQKREKKSKKMEKVFSAKERSLYSENIQPVAAAHSSLWESDKMVTMSDLVDEADFAEFFDRGPDIEISTTTFNDEPQSPLCLQQQEPESIEALLDLKMAKLSELAGQSSHSAQVWKSDQMVTMNDLIKFDEPIEEPKSLNKRIDINLAVKALRDIQASNGDRMFGLLDQFLSSHQIETKPTPLLDELYKLRDENEKAAKEPRASVATAPFAKIEPKLIQKNVSRQIQIAPKPDNSKLDTMIGSSSGSSSSYRRKRQINNQAAKKSRANKKARIDASSEKIDRLEKENPVLEEKLINYEDELEALKRKLEFYERLNL